MKRMYVLILLTMFNEQVLFSMQSMLLKPCDVISSPEIGELSRQWSGTWDVNNSYKIHMQYNDEQVIAGIVCNETLYTSLPESAQHLLTQTAEGFEFCSPDSKENSSVLPWRTQLVRPSSYIVYKERRYDSATKPHEMSIEECAQLIKNKRIVFYTGAGISAAADIYTMKQLQELIGLHREYSDPNAIAYFIKNVELIKAQFALFCQTAFDHAPTGAHQTLKEIVTKKQCQLFTENFDFLHERTGVRPIKCEGQFLREHIDPTEFAQIDAIICLGLSEDDRGLLGWYKSHNPNGTIVALDLAQPNYLSDEDFLVRGDVQTILPVLQSLIC